MSSGQLRSDARRALLQHDFESALRLLEQHLEHSPSDSAARVDLSLCHLSLKNPTQALRHASATIAGPESLRARLIKAKALRALQRMDAAAQELRATLSSKKLPIDLRLSAAAELSDLCLNLFGDPEGAANVLGQTRHASLKERAAETRLLSELYLGRHDTASLAMAFTRHARKYLDVGVAKKATARRTGHSSNTRVVGRPRIGIISPSLGATPVGFLTLGALQVLSEKADLIFFDRSPGYRDWLAQGFRQSASEWIACSAMKPSSLANQLAQSDLDALIDCGGWTDMDALRALSMRPAPRQFKWVGGQALTTGLDCFDGFLTDRWQVPKASERLYREPILRFEGPYVTYVPPPYFTMGKAAKAKSGVYALVSNPAKISPSTLNYVKRLKPKRLLMIDHRWRYQHTRDRFLATLKDLASNVEFIVPNGHREYLETLRDAPATFIDTRPYSMGLTAIELLLMGKTIVGAKPPSLALMCERHRFGHQQTTDFAGYAAQASQLYEWCTR
jgi:predicted O-linked N-acetylglucosamine transferase (SPINDLY family)